jgi:hypothetical protein
MGDGVNVNVVDVEPMRQTWLQWVNEAFSETYQNHEQDIVVPNLGTTSVLVAFAALPTRQVLAEIRAPVLEDLPVTPGLVERVAWMTGTFQIGFLSLHRDGLGSWLQFSYSMLAEMGTPALINQLVSTVGHTADRLSRELQPRLGGTFIHAG